MDRMKDGCHIMQFLAAPIVALVFLILPGCGSSVNVKIGGVETSSPEILGPVHANRTGKPQLSFCVTKGILTNTFKHRSGAVKDDDYYHLHIADFLKQEAPFESIEMVTGDVERHECDVLLNPITMVYVTPMGNVEASMTVTAVTADRQGRGLLLMTVSVRDEASVEAAGAKTGRMVYNAFVPGSTLYGRIALGKEEAARDFEVEAARYRTLAIKPALPEEARRYKVQAEAAINRKSFAEAADLYRNALKIAPWWPEGHYNRALILGETGGYRNAIGEMKKYLMLVPGAEDAQAAQDKIYEWEGLVGKPRGTEKH